MIFTVDQRVQTCFGAGKVVGFERFDLSGASLPLAQTDNGTNRVVVELDTPKNWVGHEKGNPYFFHRELEKSNPASGA